MTSTTQHRDQMRPPGPGTVSHIAPCPFCYDMAVRLVRRQLSTPASRLTPDFIQ